MNKFWMYVAGGFAGLTALAGGCGELLNHWAVSKGDRTGYIVKLTQKGHVYETPEGTLALSGMSEQGANTWDFSLNTRLDNIDDLEKQAKGALDTKQEVIIGYRQVEWVWPWRSETKYMVESITPVKKMCECPKEPEAPAAKQ